MLQQYNMHPWSTVNGSVSDASPPENLTVSPQELMLDNDSTPPSAAWTNLSTPSSLPSFTPNTSPIVNGEEFEFNGPRDYSLFPVDPNHPGSTVQETIEASHETSQEASPMVRSASSSSGSPPTGRPATRHASVAGVKPRNRDKPLPPIKYDTSDPVAAKRARNTEAARKSRARKLEAMDGQ